MMRKIRAQLQKIRTAGQAVVEFALAATLIFFLLSASIDLGMIFFALQGLHNAAQEGAMYGSAMPFNDKFDLDGDGTIDTDDETDTDGDGIVENDIYDDKNGQFFPEFLDEVRKRASYEAGQRGGIGFISLRDLDGNGEFDDMDTLRKYIDVKVVQVGTNDPCGDPDADANQCSIRVRVSTDYHIQFPLAPALPDDKVRLNSEFTVELNKSGFSRFGKPVTEPITATIPPTLTPTAGLTYTNTPTPTPPPACDDFVAEGESIAPWQEQDVGYAEGTGATEGDVTNATIKMCVAAKQIFDQSDDFYYIYNSNSSPVDSYQEFSGSITDWTRPGADDPNNLKDNQPETKAGLMIRLSVVDSSAFAMVSYRPIDNKVLFQYRSQQVENAITFGSADASAPTVWFRMRRLGNQVRAWYSTSGPSDWQPILDGSGNAWATITDFENEDNLLYGTAMTSGYEPNTGDVDGYIHRFGKAIFENVEFESTGLDMSVTFVNPTNGQTIGTDPGATFDEETAFETDITIDNDDISVTNVEYWMQMQGPEDGSNILTRSPGSGDDDECFFGGEVGSCEGMSDDIYARLTARGPDNPYRVFVSVEFDDPNNTILQASRTFYLQDLEIRFVIPEVTLENNGPTFPLNTDFDTNFQLEAYDPSVGDEPGDGIARVTYAMDFTPIGDGDRREIYRMDTEAEGRTSDLMCMFGGESDGDNHNCNAMPTAEGEGWTMTNAGGAIPPNYNTLQGGTYRIWAEVKTDVETDNGATSPQVLFYLQVEPPDYLFVVPEEDNKKEIKERDDSPFEVEAWMPHIGTDNGDGVGLVAFQILEGDDPSDVLNDVIYASYSMIDNANEPFCAFGPDGSNECLPMPTDDNDTGLDFYKLAPGTYTIRVMVLYEGQDSEDVWTTWRKIDNGDGTPRNYRRFIVPELPVYVDFVNADSDELPDHLGYITDREDQTRFRVKAYVEEGGNTADGYQIEEVEFELRDMMNSDVVTGFDNPTDTSSNGYCMFGDAGSSCQPMDETMYDEHMVSVTADKDEPYTIRARAKTELYGGRWSDWVERTFSIPQVEMRFVDPDPEPDDDNNDYPSEGNEDDQYHQDDNRKVVKSYDETEFQIEAFDPKYLNNAEAYEYNTYDPNDEDKLDDLFADAEYAGVGIEQYEFLFCDTDEDDCNEDDNELEEPYLTEKHSQDNQDDPMCAFGEDGDDCDPMDEGKFNQIPRGIYIVKARVGTKIYERNGWTDWFDHRWIEAEFEKPSLYMNFENNTIRSLIPNNTLTDIGFKVYDPLIGMGNGNLKVNDASWIKFSMRGPEPANTEVYTRWIDDLPVTNTLNPDYGASENYCVFGGVNGNCETMDLERFKSLPSGNYKMVAQVQTVNEYFTHESDSFQLPAGAIDVKFASVYTETYFLENRNDEAATFTAQAWKRGLTEADNGMGVQKVEFALVLVEADGTETDMTTMINTGEISETIALSPPYCPFGEQGNSGTCSAMPNATYNNLRDTLTGKDGAYYILRVRAQQDDADGGRWSNTLPQRFVVP